MNLQQFSLLTLKACLFVSTVVVSLLVSKVEDWTHWPALHCVCGEGHCVIVYFVLGISIIVCAGEDIAGVCIAVLPWPCSH